LSHSESADSSRIRVAVITGGEGDLATAIAETLGIAGYQVHAPGRDCLDVRSAASVDAFFAELGSPCQLLINQAGCTADAPFSRMSGDQWDQVVDTSLGGAFRCSRAAIRPMLKARVEGGHLIQIGSFSALHGNVGQANYTAAKAGLIGLTRSLALEVGGRGIRANCILPGFLETKMTAGLPDDVVDEVRARHALGRFTTVEETARFILAVDKMMSVSGQVFNLDSRISRW